MNDNIKMQQCKECGKSYSAACRQCLAAKLIIRKS
jgi:hypothetical protein